MICIDLYVLSLFSGYYFMDSPGNDLESIAGQVASGCNVIFFVTGNGVGLPSASGSNKHNQCSRKVGYHCVFEQL